jgi:hypothetical protein
MPTVAEMQASLKAAVEVLGPDAETTLLGTSRQGRPIGLVSIGHGERSALIVGAPNPSEPIGCLTIAHLVDRLAQNADFRRGSGYRWHFIQAIDIDGLVRNEPWFSQSWTLAGYMANFFRPAFDRQAEYTFPIDIPGYRFDRPTRENLCWQEALELTRPHLLCSLHGADVGGAFFIASRDLPDLTANLGSLPARLGVKLNAQGEPFAEMNPYAPGVLSFPAITAMIQGAIRSRRPTEAVWRAGQSSAEFAAAKYGSFSLTSEVALWHEQRRTSAPQVRMDMRSVMERDIVHKQQTIALLFEHPCTGPEMASGIDAEPYLASINEGLASAKLGVTMLKALLEARHWNTALPEETFAAMDATLALASIRPIAMLRQLAAMAGGAATERAAAALMDQRLTEFDRDYSLSPVPLAAQIEVQTRAILMGAGALKSLPIS